MKKFGIFVLLVTVSASWLGLSAQFDSKDWDKQIELTEVRNRHKPKGVSRGFRRLYKKEYGLSKAKLPFNSFTSIYPGYESILLHRNDYMGTWSNQIVLASSNGDIVINELELYSIYVLE